MIGMKELASVMVSKKQDWFIDTCNHLHRIQPYLVYVYPDSEV